MCLLSTFSALSTDMAYIILETWWPGLAILNFLSLLMKSIEKKCVILKITPDLFSIQQCRPCITLPA